MKLASSNLATQLLAILCTALIAPGNPVVFAQGNAPAQSPNAAPDAPPLTADQLDSLVAPIALYADQLVAQVLAASTYPLEVVEASRWLNQNKSLKGDALTKAAAQQDWDASIQALVLLPDVLQKMDENLKWTTALGNAFLAQQTDVMMSIQRLRQRAQAGGALQSNAQQKVEVQQTDGAKVIVIQPSSPDVIYVPTYNPTVVFGAAPPYAPYPAMVYPPSTGAIIATGLISFGAGVAIGAFFGGGGGWGWGWGCNWGRHPTVIVNNTFINRAGFRGSPYARTGTGVWAHNPAFRGAVPYSNRSVAARYGAGAGRPVATPYKGGAGMRPPNGAPGAITGPNGRAGGVRTPNGAPGAITAPSGGAARIAPPNGGAGRIAPPQGGMNRITPPTGGAGRIAPPQGGANRIAPPQGGANRIAPPQGGANRTAPPSGGGARPPQGTFTNPRPNVFSGGGAQTRMNSQRGGASMGGAKPMGGGARTGGGRPGGGGRRR